MRCYECGKEIPFIGSVCPFCMRDKSKDQKFTIMIILFGFGLGILGWIIFKTIGGAAGGFLIGSIIAYVRRFSEESKPPEVNILDNKFLEKSIPEIKQTHNPITSIADRLEKLNELRNKGLIDETEYQTKRNAIIDEI